jgi:hypothetical protein|tara:strand:+ start:583 stop:759 length:177 start_codon:yes stop_codon:yes gene_type:complete
MSTVPDTAQQRSQQTISLAEKLGFRYSKLGSTTKPLTGRRLGKDQGGTYIQPVLVVAP